MSPAGSRTAVSVRLALLAAVVLSAVAAVTPARAALAAPALTGSVTVTGTRTSSVLVRLPRDVALPADNRGTVKVSGAGRGIGLFLQEVDGDDQSYGLVRMRFCETPGCTVPDKDSYPFSLSTAPAKGTNNVELGAGLYRLYLIADGRPVTATLRLPGIAGTSTLQPREAAGPGPVTLAPRTAVGGQNNTRSAGSTFTLRGDNNFFAGLVRLRSNAWVGGAVTTCVYPGGPPPGPTAYAPGCPGAGFALIGDTVVAPVPTDRRYLAATGLPKGTYGLGSSYAAAATIRESVSVALVLDIP